MNTAVVLINGILPMIVSILFILVLVYVVSHKLKRILFYNIGTTNNELDAGDKKTSVLKSFMIYNNRIMKDKLSAVNHNLIIIGFVLILVGYLLNVVQTIMNTIGNVIFLQGNVFYIISFLSNLGAVMLFLGSGIALLRRLSGKLPRLEKSPRHITPLIVYLFSALIIMAFEGLKSMLYENGDIYSFMGSIVVSPIKGLLTGWRGLDQAYVFSWYLLSFAVAMMVLSLINGRCRICPLQC